MTNWANRKVLCDDLKSKQLHSIHWRLSATLLRPLGMVCIWTGLWVANNHGSVWCCCFPQASRRTNIYIDTFGTHPYSCTKVCTSKSLGMGKLSSLKLKLNRKPPDAHHGLRSARPFVRNSPACHGLWTRNVPGELRKPWHHPCAVL